MNKTKSALILCHKYKMDVGTIGPVLKARGYDLDFQIGFRDPLPAIDPLHHDLAVVMGGSMGVYEADDYPYLKSEMAYLKARMAARKPTLGICLGGQLMAASLGQIVEKGVQGPELGWHNIHVTAAGKDSPVRHLDAAHTKVAQAHSDRFNLPEDAVLLASSPLYPNQAFSIGPNILGFQCHPEVNEEIIEFWLQSKAYFTQTGLTLQDIRRDTAQYADTLKKQTEKMLNEWLDGLV